MNGASGFDGTAPGAASMEALAVEAFESEGYADGERGCAELPAPVSQPHDGWAWLGVAAGSAHATRHAESSASQLGEGRTHGKRPRRSIVKPSAATGR